MKLPTSGQVAAAGRNALSFIMGGITLAATWHIVSASDAATIGTSVGEISTGLAHIAAGVAPLVTIACGWYAAWSASHASQVSSVKAAVADGSLKGVQITGAPKA